MDKVGNKICKEHEIKVDDPRSTRNKWNEVKQLALELGQEETEMRKVLKSMPMATEYAPTSIMQRNQNTQRNQDTQRNHQDMTHRNRDE